MKDRFFGKYYKFVTTHDFSFALIDSTSNEGPAMQLITRDGGFWIQDLSSVSIKADRITLAIHQEDVTMEGEISMTDFHPLKGKAMGPFSLFSMECSHEVYSMYHKLDGKVTYQGVEHSFAEGHGYIEGDSGVNFPEKYIWYNAGDRDYGVTLAIATIPFGLIHFTGILGFVMVDGKEYDLCTYTGAKIVQMTPECFEIRKGSYRLRVSLTEHGGHMLKAPMQGNMSRYIKENVAVPTNVILMKKEQVLLERYDAKSSLEYMY